MQTILTRVTQEGMRPEFPPQAPPAYAGLAQQCWDGNPAMRPTFSDVLLELKAMQGVSGRPSRVSSREMLSRSRPGSSGLGGPSVPLPQAPPRQQQGVAVDYFPGGALPPGLRMVMPPPALPVAGQVPAGGGPRRNFGEALLRSFPSAGSGGGGGGAAAPGAGAESSQVRSGTSTVARVEQFRLAAAAAAIAASCAGGSVPIAASAAAAVPEAKGPPEGPKQTVALEQSNAASLRSPISIAPTTQQTAVSYSGPQVSEGSGLWDRSTGPHTFGAGNVTEAAWLGGGGAAAAPAPGDTTQPCPGSQAQQWHSSASAIKPPPEAFRSGTSVSEQPQPHGNVTFTAPESAPMS